MKKSRGLNGSLGGRSAPIPCDLCGARLERSRLWWWLRSFATLPAALCAPCDEAVDDGADAIAARFDEVFSASLPQEDT